MSSERFREYREYIEDYLERYYNRFDSEPQKILFDSMKYSLLAGGKHSERKKGGSRKSDYSVSFHFLSSFD